MTLLTLLGPNLLCGPPRKSDTQQWIYVQTDSTTPSHHLAYRVFKVDSFGQKHDTMGKKALSCILDILYLIFCSTTVIQRWRCC